MGNATIVNFASGETSPKSRGRFDIPSYNSSCRKMENFIPEVQGSARFRTGFRKIVAPMGPTYTRLIPFVLDSTAAYIVVFSASGAANQAGVTIYDESGTVVDSITGVALDKSYRGDELADIKFAQSGGELFLTHPDHFPKRLTRSYLGVFTLDAYVRTNDPFPAPVQITGWTSAAAGQMTLSAAVTDESIIKVYTVNGNPVNFQGAFIANGVFKYRLVLMSGTTYAIKDAVTGAAVDTTLWPAYSSSTLAINVSDMPITVSFYEGRLFFFGTRIRPNTLFGSRSPNPTTGVARYADFTGGADADHAVFFTLAPSNGRIDYARWLAGLPSFLLAGTVGGVFRISGSGVNSPITPDSISVRQIDSNGCSTADPVVESARVFFVSRGGKPVRSFQYSVDADDYISSDDLKNADQISYSPAEQAVFQSGPLNRLWVRRTDGSLACMSVSGEEGIRAWHRYVLGGTAPKVLDMAVLPRPDAVDQLCVLVSRTVNGTTVGSLEVLSNDVDFPDIEDYFTSSTASATDAATYRAAALAVLKTAAHLDSYVVYNGAPATTISGIDHLKGETVTAVADGVECSGLVVSAGGAITLPTAASVVVVGLPYTGRLQTQNLEVGGRSGPAQSKPRNINALNIRFLNSKGGQYGTDLYHLYDIETEDPDALELADGSAAPVFNGIRTLQHSDVWSTETDRNEKTVFIQQTKPFPCVVQFIDVEYETGDE